MGKSKKSVDADVDESMDVSQIDESPRMSYEEQLNNVSVIATPMAPKKLAKRLYKLVKKASEHKTFLRHGLKDVQACIRKGETGMAIFAGDVTPIEVMCHMPAVCEEKNIPYIYTPSRDDLGLAMGVKRSCLMVLVKENPEYQELGTGKFAPGKFAPVNSSPENSALGHARGRSYITKRTYREEIAFLA